MKSGLVNQLKMPFLETSLGKVFPDGVVAKDVHTPAQALDLLEGIG